jgi:hypothetical protein
MSGARKLCGTPHCYELAVQLEPVHMCVGCGGEPLFGNDPRPCGTCGLPLGDLSKHGKCVRELLTGIGDGKFELPYTASGDDTTT